MPWCVVRCDVVVCGVVMWCGDVVMRCSVAWCDVAGRGVLGVVSLSVVVWGVVMW